MIAGVSKVVVDVDDQERAKTFWVEKLGFDVVQDTPYGAERWLEVRTPDGSVVLVLSPRGDERPRSAPDMLPTSNVMFYCDDMEQAHREMTARGVEFPQAPSEQSFGWWSLFCDEEGNRFALLPRGQ
jgi:predicted enzyme related to lactoylglutathione lyase